MNKLELKKILFELRKEQPWNEQFIIELLGKVDQKTDEDIFHSTENMNEVSIKNKLKSLIEQRKKNLISSNKIYNANNIFEYDIDEDRVRIHLPGDFHEMFQKKGTLSSSCYLGERLINAIQNINNEKRLGNFLLKDCKSIYMMSPIFYAPSFHPEILRQLKFDSVILKLLKFLGFETKSFMQGDLTDTNLVSKNPEMQSAIKDFETNKDIGIASLNFEKISSENWQIKAKILTKLLNKYCDINFER